MSFEIVYTSVRKGLQGGSKGFCTVAATRGVPPVLQDKLESLSGYRHAYGTSGPNPVNYSYLTLKLAGQSFHVLSRVGDAGADYSNRTNKIGHHLAFGENERPNVSLGPVSLMSDDQFWIENWGDRPPEYLDPIRFPVESETGSTSEWKRVFGDPGWAGELARSCENGPSNVTILIPPDADALALVEEAMRIVPAQFRWDLSFSTYYTRMVSGVDCHWRFVLQRSEEASKLSVRRGMTILDPHSQQAHLDSSDPWIAAARDGTGTPLSIKVRGRRRRAPKQKADQGYEAFPFRSPEAFASSEHTGNAAATSTDTTSQPPSNQQHTQDETSSPAFEDYNEFETDYETTTAPDTPRRPMTQSQLRRRQRAEAARQNRLGTPQPVPAYNNELDSNQSHQDSVDVSSPKTAKQDSRFNSRKKIILAALGLILVCAGGYLIWESRQPEILPGPPPSIGGEVNGRSTVSNEDPANAASNDPNNGSAENSTATNIKTQPDDQADPDTARTAVSNDERQTSPDAPLKTDQTKPAEKVADDSDTSKSTAVSKATATNTNIKSADNENPPAKDAALLAGLHELKNELTLPAVSETTNAPLFDVIIPRGSQFSLQLVGGSEVAPGNNSFELQPASESGDPAIEKLANEFRYSWVVSYGSNNVLDADQRKNIAVFFHDKRRGMAFRWLSSADVAGSELLQFCLLRVTVGSETEYARLNATRPSVPSGNFSFNGLDSNVAPIRLPVTTLPAPEIVYLDFRIENLQRSLRKLPAVPGDVNQFEFRFPNTARKITLNAADKQPATVYVSRVFEKKDAKDDTSEADEEKSRREATRRKRKPHISSMEFKLNAKTGTLTGSAFAYIGSRNPYLKIIARTAEGKPQRQAWERQRTIFERIRQCPVEFRLYYVLPVADDSNGRREVDLLRTHKF